jgi:CRP/FNR family cyclic AMP-dependent transcriptional regulator
MEVKITINLFKYIKDKKELIDLFVFEKFKKGEKIFSEGEEGDFMYIILEGEVRISLLRDKEEIILANLKHGNFFGEMGLFKGDTRSADVKAVTDLKLIKITKEDIDRLKKSNSELAFEFIYGVCEELCKRLHFSDESIESYYYINRALLRNPQFRKFVQKIWNKKEV